MHKQYPLDHQGHQEPVCIACRLNQYTVCFTSGSIFKNNEWHIAVHTVAIYIHPIAHFIQ